MATPMLSVLHKTRASLDAERTARAQGAARAARGYFAAVMGRSIERALTDVFADRSRYIGEVQAKNCDLDAILLHVNWHMHMEQ